MWLDKGDYPENTHIVFCANKWRSFEPFMCVDRDGTNFLTPADASSAGFDARQLPVSVLQLSVHLTDSAASVGEFGGKMRGDTN